MSEPTALPLTLPGGRRSEIAVVLSLAAFAVAALAASMAMGGDAWRLVGTLHWPLIGGLLVLSLVNYACRAARWHLYSRALDLGIAPRLSALVYVAGFAFTTTPGRIGEMVRLWLMRRIGGVTVDRSLPVMVADRVSDLAAVGLLLLAGLALVTANPTLIALASVAASLGLVLVLWPRVAPGGVGIAYRLLGRWPRLFVRLRRAAAATARLFRPALALPALGLGVAGWLAECAAFALLLTALGADIGLLAAALVFTAGMLAGALTFVPGGLGGTEATMLALLALLGVPLPVALSATLIIRVTTLWFAVGLGFVVLPSALRLARRATP